MPQYPLHSELNIGDTVRILKQNTLDVFVEGNIDEIISSMDNFRGIFVKLKDGIKGRVHELISHNLSQLYEIKPENSKLEYKERFVLSPTEIESHSKAWVVPFSVYKTIAAFANAEGGKLVIGIHDDGTFLGLQRDYDALKELKELGQFSFSPDSDGLELKIKLDCGKYFIGQEKYVLDLIDDVKFIKDSGKEICEIYVLPTYENPVIIFEKDFNINKKPVQYQIKDKVAEQLKLDPDYEIVIKDFKKINKSTTDVPLFFVRKLNGSERYTLKDFLEYWVRRMKKSFYYN